MGQHRQRISGKYFCNVLILVFFSLSASGQIAFYHDRHADTFALDTVKFSNIQNIDSRTLIGRYSAGTGDPQTIKIGQTFTLSGDSLNYNGGNTFSAISPAQLTGDNNDFSPTGWGSANLIRLDGDNGFRAITSLVSQDDGEEKTFLNIGSYCVYFPVQHPSGENQNRIQGTADLILPPKRSVTFKYDTIADRWNVKDYDFNDDYKTIVYDFPVGSTTSGDNTHFVYTTAGTASAHTYTAAGATTPSAYVASATGTTAGGAACVSIGKSSNVISYFGAAHLTMESLVSVPILSTGTDSFNVVSSICSGPANTSANVNNSIGIKYSHQLNGGNWTCFSRDNSGNETLLDSGVNVTANAFYFLRIEINKQATEARFFINGSYIGRITGNMPTGTGNGPRVGIFKGVGTNSRSLNIIKIYSRTIYP